MPLRRRVGDFGELVIEKFIRKRTIKRGGELAGRRPRAAPSLWLRLSSWCAALARSVRFVPIVVAPVLCCPVSERSFVELGARLHGGSKSIA